MLEEKQAQAIAEEFISSQDNRGFSLKFVSIRRDDQWPKEWSVVFDVFTEQGALLDGPVVVIVNEESNQARYL